MMQYCKYIQWMSSSSYKTFPISTLSIFVLLLSSTHGYPQGSSRNDTESNVTITTEDSFNTTLTTLPSQTSSENILSPSTSGIGASTNATTTPESSQETSFPPSTLSSSFVSNRTTVESSSTETSTATEEGFSYTDPFVKENVTTLSTKDTTATSVEGGENDSTTTITFPNTSTHINNTNSTPNSTTNTLITDRNETYTRLEMEEKLDDLQYQIYALCGSFGVISLLLIILLFALAYSMSKLKDQVSSTRHVPYIPDNRTAFSTGHEMQERRRSNLDKEPVPKPGYGIHNGNNPYEKNDTKPKSDRHKMENIPLDTLSGEIASDI
uniref:Uncharacterized protein n=1 Tax=Lepeophtheirus salmonis TaxID=72036 RepID=A0A0K2TBY8_LEPSM